MKILLLILILVFIVGFWVGRDYESKLWMEDMLNDFAETEHLRNENAHLKEKLNMKENYQ
jgi:hypothetical protein